ncbi:nucleoid-associated protein [Pedobacter agri]|uniref:nucleoid-associated protein n=1 Tax=Pedobacter agri TaxID=454586 RepID=UPI00292E69E0|nr:nucleoid-associated protein [Pedobacter agri]
MISFFEASLKLLSVHHTGNKLMEEYYKLSDKPLNISDEIMGNLLMQFFLKPFEKTNEVYRFFHPSSNLGLNEVYHFITEIFNHNDGFHEGSEQLAKHLYDVANHPKIKSGEFYVAFFEKVQIEGEQLDAIGIFKSETKDTYLKVFPQLDGFGMSYEQDAISINKLDKGCLVFKTEKDEGYKVVVFDQAKSANDSAVYWKDEFLQLNIRNDNYNQTSNLLTVYKNFVKEKLDDEFEISKADKVDLLNKSMKYFKEKETFDLDEFSNEVIGNEQGISLFKSYKENYETEYESPISGSFEISDSAVKKQLRAFKNIIKLDKNFDIYIHGNKDMIEKGYDDDKSMNFYKLYFREEI